MLRVIERHSELKPEKEGCYYYDEVDGLLLRYAESICEVDLR